MKVKRRDDPTSAKVSTILGSYDRAKELVTSSHMIGAILQPATPRPPSKHSKFEAPSPLLAPSARASNRKQAGAARNGLRPELSRQGVFEQFQQSGDDKASDVTRDVSRQLTDPVDRVVITASSSSSSQADCEKTRDCSRQSVHVANGRHKPPSSSSSSSSASKRQRLKLSIPSPKVSMHYNTTRHV